MLNKFINGLYYHVYYSIYKLFYYTIGITKSPFCSRACPKSHIHASHPTNVCAYDCVSLGKVNDCDSLEEGILDPSKKLFRIGSSTSDDVINHRWTDCLDLEATSRIDQRKSKKCTHPPISLHTRVHYAITNLRDLFA